MRLNASERWRRIKRSCSIGTLQIIDFSGRVNGKCVGGYSVCRIKFKEISQRRAEKTGYVVRGR